MSIIVVDLQSASWVDRGGVGGGGKRKVDAEGGHGATEGAWGWKPGWKPGFKPGFKFSLWEYRGAMGV